MVVLPVCANMLRPTTRSLIPYYVNAFNDYPIACECNVGFEYQNCSHVWFVFNLCYSMTLVNYMIRICQSFGLSVCPFIWRFVLFVGFVIVLSLSFGCFVSFSLSLFVWSLLCLYFLRPFCMLLFVCQFYRCWSVFSFNV